MNLQAQNDTDTQKVMKEFEKYCPLYVLENYCSEKGLTRIIESAKLDERVMGINTSNQFRPKRPEIAIKYNIILSSLRNIKLMKILRSFIFILIHLKI